MDKIEEYLEDILAGRPLLDESAAIADLTLAQHVQELASKGVESTVSADYKPIVKKSVAYVVAAVLLNDKGEVLMMQEAKSSCAGTWYLPAGRMEPGEDIVDAVKREVLEETGIEFEPTTLLLVESAQGNWYRFVFTGQATGGELKTVARADAESLQASWIDDLNQLSLRARDILPLIEKARNYASETEPWHEPLMPVIQQHSQLLLRLVIIIRKKANNKVHVLVSEKEVPHLPICEVNPSRSIHSSLKRFIQTIFHPEAPPHKPHGALSVEHSGQPMGELDGLCLSVLVSCRVALEQVSLSSGYTWLEVDSVLGDALLNRLGRNMTVALSVIR